MRLSDLSRSTLMINTLNRNREKMDKLQLEASSGERIVTVTDNPGEYSTLLRYKDAMSLSQGYIDNIKSARNELNIYESLTDQLVSTMRDVKTLVVQASNDAGYSDAVSALRERVDGLLGSFINLANNSVKGEYMFSGSKTLTQPFTIVRDGSGKVIDAVYQGDNISKTFNPDSAERIVIDLSGDEIFQGPAGMDQNIFQELVSIRNDLRDDKFRNKDAHLANTEKIYDRFVNKQGEIGTVTQHLDRLEDFLTSYDHTIQEKSAEIEYVDLAETISTLLNQEFIYKSSLEVAARMNNLSLLDYMR